MGHDPKALVERIVGFSIDNLQRLCLPSGLYCFDTPSGGGELRGESVRYSLMVLLGCQRASSSALPVPDLDALWDVCFERTASMTPGDLGLALWADSRRGHAHGAQILSALERSVPEEGALAPLVGMEIGWMLIGLAEAVDALPAAEPLLRRVAAHLLGPRRARSGLYFHDGRSRLRRRLPNFATEIYTLLALARVARNDLVPGARRSAESLGEILVRLQLPDGAWPWLFDAERGSIVERYELYSVHQDAMAPMAMVELSELTGDRRWLDAAIAGLAWSHGENELGVDMFDEGSGLVHRSLRRSRPWDRSVLIASSASALSIGRPLERIGTPIELNRTCRPYHLGWILEAWAGRQHLFATDGV